jgi:hypothetical protein
MEDLLSELRELQRTRQLIIRETTSLSNRVFSYCMRYHQGLPEGEQRKEANRVHTLAMDRKPEEEVVATIMTHAAPFLEGIDLFDEQRNIVEKRMKKAARQLPVAHFQKSTWGFSEVQLAQIIGETGDLNNFRSKSALWKYMELAVIDGERQRRKSEKYEALRHGYGGQRRSIMWNISSSLIGGMGKGVRPMVGEDIEFRSDLSPYQKSFIHRLRFEAEKDPAMYKGETAQGKESYTLHAANRARRYVAKELLRDLRWAWIEATQIEKAA